MSAHAVDLLAGAIGTASWLALAGPPWRDLRPALAWVAAALIVALAAFLACTAELVSAASP